VDLIAAVLALLLGAFSVADVLAVNLRDRAGEQAVLAATGWRPATLFRLAFTEGMVVGIVGAIAGGAVGLGLAAILTGISACCGSIGGPGLGDRTDPGWRGADGTLVASVTEPPQRQR
jgi:ABC-type antimicrobial peptide transport system permease subunit